MAVSARRPQRPLHFMGHKRFEPPLIIDLGPVWQEKLDLVRCFPSPLRPETPADTGEHLLFGADILERVEAKARLCGERIGARYSDPCSAVVSTVVSCQPATCWRSPAAAPSARRGRGRGRSSRIAATIGPDALAALPTTLRLVLFDTHLPEPAIPALNACLGIPDWSERSGTWRNIDGHHGQLLPARPAPSGTRPLAATLAVLADLVIPINGSPQVAAHDMSTEVSQ